MKLTPGTSFSVGALASDMEFFATRGVVSWSTDGGTTKDNLYGPEHSPLNMRGRIILTAGLTVDLYNDRLNSDCEVEWMPA